MVYSKLQLAKKYLHYFLTASSGRGHGIHSPFVYDFVINVLNDDREFYAYKPVEDLRKALLADRRLIEVEDFGAGSAMAPGKQRSVASIARHAAKPPRLGQLLFRIVNHYQPGTIIELGTSLGLSSAYLASGNPFAKVITVEGSPSLSELAEKNFRKLSLHNIEQVTGNFDGKLPGIIDRLQQIDLAFIDGNHRREPTLLYFNRLMNKIAENTVFIFDDIHWSREMEEAWQAIKDDLRVMLTVDLFFLGLVFFRKDFKVKQDFSIRFRL